MITHSQSRASAALLTVALFTSVVSAQNVGIGTTTPKSKLSVNGSTASGGMAIGDTTYTSTTGTVAPLNGAIIQGFTGIGTPAPSQLLHVFDGNAFVERSDGNASVLTNIDGGISVFRDGPGRNVVPSVNGYIDFRNDSASFGRISYYKGAPGDAPPNDVGEGLRLSAGTDTGLPHLLVEANSGNVGLNTHLPQSRLDVRGTTKIMSTTGVQTGEFWSGTSNVDGFEVTSYPDDVVTVGIQRAGVFPPLHLSKPAGAAPGDLLLSLIVGGNLNGSVSVTAGGVSFNTTSDERLKENIRPSAKGLADVMKIQVSDYNYKASPDRAETGFIAQQLHAVWPNAVTPGGEDPAKAPWTVDYGRVTPVLVKAIQEQQAEIDSLTAKVATAAKLEEKNIAQEARIAALEAENRQMKEKMASVEAIGARLEALEKGLVVAPSSPVQTVSTGR